MYDFVELYGECYGEGTKVKVKKKGRILGGADEGVISYISDHSFYIVGDIVHQHIYKHNINQYDIEIIEPVYYQPQELIPNKDCYPSKGKVEIGWIWYVLVMILGAIFKDRIWIWILTTAYFFIWKSKQL